MPTTTAEEERLLLFFRGADVTEDGVLSRADIDTLTARVSEILRLDPDSDHAHSYVGSITDWIEKILANADADGDGAVTAEEYLAYCRAVEPEELAADTARITDCFLECAAARPAMPHMHAILHLHDVRQIDSLTQVHSLRTSPEEEPRPRGWGLPLAVLIVGMFMSVLDISIVNVAMPVMRNEFGGATDDIQWVSTAYSLCEGVVVPASAWVGARFGLRRTYLVALVAFAVVSAGCGLAPNLSTMVVFRILQAVPGGVIPVICLTMLYRLVPPHKLGIGMGLYGLGIVLAPGIGPTLGGYLVEYVDWRLIFFINVPIGIGGAVAAMAVLPKFPDTPAGRFDVPGFACIATALFALLLALEEGSSWGWTSYPVLILLTASVHLLALFVVVELQSSHPLLDVRALVNWPFVNSLLLMAMISICMFVTVFYVPMFLQGAQGITPWNTGLTLLPQAFAMMAVLPAGGWLYDRIGARWPSVAGLLAIELGLMLMTRINPDTGRGELMLWTSLVAGGAALAMMPVMAAGLAALSPELVDSGSAFSTLAQRVSSALGLAVLTGFGTIVQAQLFADRSGLLNSQEPSLVHTRAEGVKGLVPLWKQHQELALTGSYTAMFLVCCLVAMAGVWLALFLRSGAPAGADGERVALH